MQSERWQTCTDVFNDAVEQPPDERAAFLERRCDGDEALRRKVELLLKYHDRSEDFIKSPAFEVAPELLTGDPETLVGQHLGCYRVDAVAGVGGMGVVYLAWDERLGRKVALKLLPQSMVANEGDLERLKREARTASALNHPNIVTIHDIGEVDSTHYVATEFIEGTTLRERMTQGPIRPNEALDIAAQVASALCLAHGAGIVHRDIKPENIMLRPDGYVKVLDFGIAKLTQQETLDTTTALGAQLPTQQSMMLGTTRYMSPEQAMAQQVDARSDLWSLGVVLYEMLAGRPPFEGETATDVMAAIIDRDPQPLKHRAPVVPPALQSVVDRSLRKDPAERYQTAEEILSELRAIREKAGGIAARSTRWIAVAAIAAIVVGLALFYAWRGGRTDPARAPAVTEKSIAVLPFENLSRDPDNAYFADGIQEEILTRLASIADLKVISRTSTQRYQSKPRNLREIAKQLGVANILEGSVHKAADQVRVNVQLVNAQTDSHLWADSYDRKLTDLFGVENEIAKGIAESLQAKLNGREERVLAVKPTNNPEAYGAYLRGLAFEGRSSSSYGGYSPDLVGQAAGFYERAVQLDPNFALAWARLSRVNAHLCFSAHAETASDRREAAKDALDNAQKLEPNSPETLLALGYYQYWGLRDYAAAKITFGHVSKMLPSNSEMPMALGRVTRREGRWDESIAYFEQALALDPRNVELLNGAGETYSMVRQFPVALKLCDRALDITPNDPDLMASKASIYQAQGNLQEAAKLLVEVNAQTNSAAFAIKITQLRLERNYGEAVRLLQARLAQFHFNSQLWKAGDQVSLAWMQRFAGDTAGAKVTAEEARNTLEQLYRDQPDNGAIAVSLSLAYAAMGEKDLALKTAAHPIMLLPRTKDSKVGPMFEENLALIQTMLGENSGAISILTQLLQTPYGSGLYGAPVTPALLRLDPTWDPFRADPAFRKLCEADSAPATTGPEKSIAVLPFENLSKDEENAFFAAGVQDEILTNLAKVAELKVISRTSVMKYKSGLERNLREIAETLGVSHVVEGSVQRAGGRVRVNVQLIDARNDAHLWAEHFDRDVADIFAIQSEIAERIADQLRAKLSSAEKAAIAERPTADMVAYTYYTRANEINIWTDNWEGAEKNGNQKVELLEKATQRDPNFVLAYCELAITHLNVGEDDAEHRKHIELAKTAAETAVRLRPDLPEAHLALARYYFETGVQTNTNNYDRAHEELAIVRRKLPNNAQAIMIEALIGRHQKRWDASLVNLQRANELDPRNGEIAFRLEQIYFEMRRYSEFERLIRKEAAMGGYKLEDPFIQTWLAQMKLAQGDPVAAQSFLEQVPLEYGNWDTRFMATLYLRDYDAADRMIAATPAKYVHNDFGLLVDSEKWAGLLARVRGDQQKAQAAFAAAREKLEAKVADNPNDPSYLADLAIVDAGLGRKEEATREARRVVELQPISGDSVNGPQWVANLALVYAWTGELNRALEQLEKVATIPGSPEVPTYGDLRFNPRWDDLRGDPRFDKIVAAAKAASR